MFEWWNGLPMIQQVFYILAIPSTIVLLLQTILLLFGVGGGHDADVSSADVDAGGDLDAGGAELDPSGANSGDFVPEQDGPFDQGPEHEAGLRILTVRGIVAFLAIAGWVGVAAVDMGAGAGLAAVLAVIAGLAAMLLVAVVLRASLKLQQSGNLDLRNAVGSIGEVYVPIPEGGKGKVTLVMQERYMELDASCPERALHTGERVKVVSITQSNTLIVTPVGEYSRA